MFISASDLVNKQAVLCHRVLRAIESVAKESAILTRETWEVLLKFLLAANDSLLSPPTEKGTILHYGIYKKRGLLTVKQLPLELYRNTQKCILQIYNEWKYLCGVTDLISLTSYEYKQYETEKGVVLLSGRLKVSY